MTDPTVKITRAAIHNRIRRKLASQEKIMKKNLRPSRSLPGEWYVVETRTNLLPRIVRDYSDLTAAARDLGVLRVYEEIDDE